MDLNRGDSEEPHDYQQLRHTTVSSDEYLEEEGLEGFASEED